MLASVQTESIHGSGITYGDGAWFITSTKVLVGKPSTLKVDPRTGATLDRVRLIDRGRKRSIENISAGGEPWSRCFIILGKGSAEGIEQ